ncbi:lactose-binding lectin l-2-like isoform X2 [Anguilla anguilla]|nr:lactose-binding lectin l-2-like isoform X2 [Anguilla anguilla]XP_035285343.1 lactose-binding lectin l-2-like isoform X2 [Anguilla anguilla]
MVSFPMSNLIFVAVLSGLTLVSEQCADTCPEGWKGFNGCCYKHFDLLKNWWEAESHCMNLGGHLASVHSNVEYQFLRELNKYSDPHDSIFWIGLTDIQKEGTWVWSDRSAVDFTTWNPGQPDDWQGVEDCVHANVPEQKNWNDVYCSQTYHFICAVYSNAAGK